MTRAKKPAPSPDLAALLTSWEISLQAERKSPKTVRVYREGAQQFIRWCAANQREAVLDRATVQAFTASLLASGAEPHTARTRQGALRRYAAWLVAEGIAEQNQLLGMPQPKLDVKVTEPLSDDEMRLLLKACDGKTFRDRRDEAIVRLMHETGARAGEVANILLEDIDVKKGIAVITRGKGGRGRIVPFGPKTGVAIDRYLRMRATHRLAHTPALWLGDRGTTHSYSSMQRALQARARIAGVTRFHPHLLRHTAATNWLAAGGAEGDLMAIAGWRSRDMLDRYVAATANTRAVDAARKLNLGDI